MKTRCVWLTPSWVSNFIKEQRKWTACLPYASHTLKRKCLHFDEIIITGSTQSCQNDNFQCSQAWKFRQNDDILFQCIEAEVQWPPFCRRHFQIYFLNDTHCILNAFNWTLIQAITRINDGLVYWRTYASLGLNNLNLCFSLWIRYCIGYRETTPSKDYLCLRKHPLNITFLY